MAAVRTEGIERPYDGAWCRRSTLRLLIIIIVVVIIVIEYGVFTEQGQ